MTLLYPSVLIKEAGLWADDDEPFVLVDDFAFVTAADWRALSIPSCLRSCDLNSLLNSVLSAAVLFQPDLALSFVLAV